MGSTWHFKQYKGQTGTGKDEGNQEVQLLLRVPGAEQQMVGLGAGEPRCQRSSDSNSVPAEPWSSRLYGDPVWPNFLMFFYPKEARNLDFWEAASPDLKNKLGSNGF